MTEQTFPTGGTALAEPPLPSLPMDAGEGAPDDRRRKLMLVGAAVGVLVLGIVAYFLLKGGSSTPAASGAPASLPPAAAPAAQHHHAKANKPLTLPKSYKGHVGRDPFKPLITAPTTAPNATGGSGTSGSTSGTSGSTSGTTNSTSGSTTGTTTTPKTPVYRPIWIQLRSISGRTALFAVGMSNHHTLRVDKFTVTAPRGSTGTIFAKTFQLLSISGGRVLLTYGDGSTFALDMTHNTMIVN